MAKILKEKPKGKSEISKRFLQSVHDRDVNPILEGSSFGSNSVEGFHRLNVIQESFMLIRGIGSVSDYNLKRYFCLDRIPVASSGAGAEEIEGQITLPSHKRGCIFYFVTLYDWQKFVELVGSHAFASNHFKDTFREHVRGCIPLQQAEIEMVENANPKYYEFIIRTPEREFNCICDSAQLRRDWVRAITSIVAQDTEEAIVSWEEQQIEINKLAVDGEARNIEIMEARDARREFAAKKKAELEEKLRIEREEEERQQKEAEAKAEESRRVREMQVRAERQFQELYEDDPSLLAEDFMVDDLWNVDKVNTAYMSRCDVLWDEITNLNAERDPEECRGEEGEWSLPKLKHALWEECERLWKVLKGLDPNAQKADFQNEDGDWDFQKLYNALVMQGNEIWDLISRLNPRADKSTYFVRGAWNFEALNGALASECVFTWSRLESANKELVRDDFRADDEWNVEELISGVEAENDRQRVQGTRLWELLNRLAPNSDLEQVDFRIEETVWDLGKLEERVEEECEIAWKILSRLNPELKKEEFVKDGEWDVEAVITALAQEGDKRSQKLQVLNPSISSDDLQSNGTWNFDNEFELTTVECEKAFVTIQSTDADAKEGDFETVHGDWDIEKVIERLLGQGGKLWKYLTRRNPGLELEKDSFLDRGMWNIPKLFEQMEIEHEKLFKLLVQLNPELMEEKSGFIENDEKTWKISKINQQLIVEGRSLFEVLLDLNDANKEEDFKADQILLEEQKDAEKTWDFVKLQAEVEIEGGKLWDQLHNLDRSLESDDHRKKIPIPRDPDDKTKKWEEPDEKEIDEQVALVIGFVEDRGADNCYFTEILDTLQIEIYDNPKLLAALKLNKHITMDGKDCLIFHTEMRQQYEDILKFLEEHLSQELSLVYVHDELGMDLAEPVHEALLKSLQRNKDISVDIEESTICYARLIQSHLDKIVRFLKEGGSEKQTFADVESALGLDVEDNDQLLNYLDSNRDIALDKDEKTLWYCGEVRVQFQRVVSFIMSKNEDETLSLAEIAEKTGINLDDNETLRNVLAECEDLGLSGGTISHSGELKRQFTEITEFVKETGIGIPVTFSEVLDSLDINLLENDPLLTLLNKDPDINVNTESASLLHTGGTQRLWDLLHTMAPDTLKSELEKDGTFDQTLLREELDKQGFKFYNELQELNEDVELDDYFVTENGEWRFNRLRSHLELARSKRRVEDIAKLEDLLLDQKAFHQVPFSEIKSKLRLYLGRRPKLIREMIKTGRFRINKDTLSHRLTLRRKCGDIVDYLRKNEPNENVSYDVLKEKTKVDLMEEKKEVADCFYPIKNVSYSIEDRWVSHTGEDPDWDIKGLQHGLHLQGERLNSLLYSLNSEKVREDYLFENGKWIFDKLEKDISIEGDKLWAELFELNPNHVKDDFVTEYGKWDFDELHDGLELSRKAQRMWDTLEKLQNDLKVQLRSGQLVGLLCALRVYNLEEKLLSAIIQTMDKGNQDVLQDLEQKDQMKALNRLDEANKRKMVSELGEQQGEQLLDYIDYSEVQQEVLKSLLGTYLKKERLQYLKEEIWDFVKLKEDIEHRQDKISQLEKEYERLCEIEHIKQEKLKKFREELKESAEEREKARDRKEKEEKRIYDQFISIAAKGAIFYKHSYHGRTKASKRMIRVVCKKDSSFHEDDVIRWEKVSSFGRVAVKTMRIKDIHSVTAGKRTATLRASKDPSNAKSTKDNSFSVVSKARTLDLQAPDKETRDTWVRGLQVMVNRHKSGLIDAVRNEPVIATDWGDLDNLGPSDDERNLILGPWRPVVPAGADHEEDK